MGRGEGLLPRPAHVARGRAGTRTSFYAALRLRPDPRRLQAACSTTSPPSDAGDGARGRDARTHRCEDQPRHRGSRRCPRRSGPRRSASCSTRVDVGGALGEANIFTTLVRAPDVFRRWLPFGGALLRGSLPARDRELLILRTAVNCTAPYEWGQHVRLGRLAGLTDDEIARVAAGPPPRAGTTTTPRCCASPTSCTRRSRSSDARYAALAAPLRRGAAHRGADGGRPLPPARDDAQRPRASPSTRASRRCRASRRASGGGAGRSMGTAIVGGSTTVGAPAVSTRRRTSAAPRRSAVAPRGRRHDRGDRGGRRVLLVGADDGGTAPVAWLGVRRPAGTPRIATRERQPPTSSSATSVGRGAGAGAIERRHPTARTG